MRENIFQYLTQNESINNAKKEDFYSQGRDSRNASHMLWCHVLLLIRTLNSNLLDSQSEEVVGNSESDVHTYLKKLVGYLHSQGLSERIQTFLCYQLNNHQAQLTQAFLEEIELIMSIICQLFMQADKLSTINY